MIICKPAYTLLALKSLNKEEAINFNKKLEFIRELVVSVDGVK